MFTLLDGLNRFLSYFNLKIKVKNRLYIVLGAITTAYIGYLTWNFFQYNAYGRGVIYLLIFLVLLYFLVLNILYYFFDKNVKWDITPLFEKFAQVDSAEDSNNSAKKSQGGMYGGKMVIYDETKQNLNDYQTFDTTLEYLEKSQESLEQLVEFMLTNHLVEKNSKKAKKPLVKKKAAVEKIYELDAGIEIPSFAIETDKEDLCLLIGLNATERAPIASIKEIGGVSANKMKETYDIVGKSAKIVGGKYTEYQNGTIHSDKEPYTIQLQVACLVRLSAQ